MKLQMIAAVAVLFSNSYAAAQQDCSDALILNSINYSGSHETRLSALRVFSESQFNKTKRRLTNGTSAIIYGIPITSDTSFTKFNELRTDEYSRFEFDYSENRSFSFASTTLGPEALEAYRICIEGNARIASSGFHAWIADTTDDIIGINIRWMPPFGSNDPLTFSVDTLMGTSAQPSDIRNTLKPNETQGFDIERTPGEDFRVTFNANGSPKRLFVSKPPVITPPPEPCYVTVQMTSNEPQINVAEVLSANDEHVVLNEPHHFASCKTDDRCYVKAERRSNGVASSGFDAELSGATTNPGGIPSYSLICRVLETRDRNKGFN